MSIVAVETVQVFRETISGKNEIGQPIKGNAPGFPKSVSGVLDLRSRGNRFDPAGLSYTVDAVFSSETFLEGLAADKIVSASGETFTVRSVAIHRDSFSGSIDHAEYSLTRVVR